MAQGQRGVRAARALLFGLWRDVGAGIASRHAVEGGAFSVQWASAVQSEDDSDAAGSEGENDKGVKMLRPKFMFLTRVRC